MKIRSLAIASLFVTSTAFAADTIINEKFSADPSPGGWQIFGDANLFHWDSTNQNLAVTWDSSRTNSYFYHPLGATFTKADSFCVQFDLKLADADAAGYFQLAVGLCNFGQATAANFSRANFASPNLFEFDYFPPGENSFGPSTAATVIDANNNLYFTYDATRPLATNVTYRIVLLHRANAAAISGLVFTNGQLFSRLSTLLDYGANNFSLDTLSINNYTTLDDFYPDSLLAHGTVDNFSFASPLPVAKAKTFAAGQIQFISDTNWIYTLEQSDDFKTWSAAAPPVAGNGTTLFLQATNQPVDKGLYRVRAELP